MNSFYFTASLNVDNLSEYPNHYLVILFMLFKLKEEQITPNLNLAYNRLYAIYHKTSIISAEIIVNDNLSFVPTFNSLNYFEQKIVLEFLETNFSNFIEIKEEDFVKKYLINKLQN